MRWQWSTRWLDPVSTWPGPSRASAPHDGERAADAHPLATGVMTRGLRSEADYAAMALVLEESRDTDGLDHAQTPDRFRDSLRSVAGFDPSEGVRLAEVDGSVVGYAYGFFDGDSPAFGRIFVHAGRVLPAWRRRGIGTTLLAQARTAALVHGARHAAPAPSSAIFRTRVEGTDEASLSLLERHGYAVSRHLFEMVRPTLSDLPTQELPAGLEVRPARLEAAAVILRAMNEAMADDWGMASYSAAEMSTWMLHPLYSQTDVWQVAWDGEEVVGGVLGFIDHEENRLLHRSRGYTECIFTRRPWRGRGVATALIGRNLRLLAERGMTEAALSVDTESPSGAVALYERVGFVRDRVSLILQRPV